MSLLFFTSPNELFEFKIGNNTLLLNIDKDISISHYTILSIVLTFGSKFWKNFKDCGGTNVLEYRFIEFIDENIILIDRDINIEKIIKD